MSLVVTERSGREVAKAYEAETGVSISYGTLYTTFRRLKESGWVSSSDSSDEDGRIRHFRLTGVGRKVLAEAVSEFDGYVRLGRAALGFS